MNPRRSARKNAASSIIRNLSDSVSEVSTSVRTASFGFVSFGLAEALDGAAARVLTGALADTLAGALVGALTGSAPVAR
jgi:hypothetical protein